MSYDLASRRAKEILEKKFQSTIADEVHYIKNKDAMRSKNLIPVFKNSKRCILISGTPLLARPDEAFNMLAILRPDIFTNFKEYANRYCNP